MPTASKSHAGAAGMGHRRTGLLPDLHRLTARAGLQCRGLGLLHDLLLTANTLDSPPPPAFGAARGGRPEATPFTSLLRLFCAR